MTPRIVKFGLLEDFACQHRLATARKAGKGQPTWRGAGLHLSDEFARLGRRQNQIRMVGVKFW